MEEIKSQKFIFTDAWTSTKSKQNKNDEGEEKDKHNQSPYFTKSNTNFFEVVEIWDEDDQNKPESTPSFKEKKGSSSKKSI